MCFTSKSLAYVVPCLRVNTEALVRAPEAVQEQQKMTSVAEWERKASTRCSWLNRARSEEEREAARMADLERRRAALAEKLQREEEQLKKELLEKQVSCGHRVG